MASILKPAYAFYNRQYQARPILTICTTNAFLAGISDSLTQKYLAPAAPAQSHKDEARGLGQDIEQTLHEPQTPQNQQLQQGAANLRDSVQSGAEQAKETLKDNALSAKDSVESAADHAATSGKAKLEEIKKRGLDGAKESGQSLKDSASSAVDHARTSGEKAAKGVQEYAKDSMHSAKESAESLKDRTVARAKDSTQLAKDETESLKDRGMAQAKDSAQYAKDSAEAAVDHVTTFGKQTAKEIRERGLAGAKDMGEGYVKAGEEMLQGGKEAIQERLPQRGVPSDSDALTLQSTPPLDYSRMGRFMFYNFSIAPVIHTWYTFLDKNFPLISGSNPAVNSPGKALPVQSSRIVQTMTPALKRMVTDQALFAPVGLALLFSGLTVLEGGGVQEIKDKLNNTYVSTLKANYMVWPLVQLVNFSVMPLQLRLPFVSVVGIAWNAYLSLANSRAQPAEKQSALGESEMAVAS